jgi:hypothetical protein
LARADLHAAYRFAVSQSDAVARFMFLYNILLQLGGDNQGGVDNLVRQEEPNVRQRLRKRKPRVMETIYTRLRNEVGHVRAEATPRQTRTEIEHNVAALQAIVKVAISRVV